MFPINLTISIAIYMSVNLVDEFVGINHIGIFIHSYLLKILDIINKGVYSHNTRYTLRRRQQQS